MRNGLSFCAGVLMVTAIRSLYQDLLGLDKYVEFVKSNWAPASYTVPIAVGMLLVAIVLLMLSQFNARQD